ncbi:MAG: MIP/aquaporin family protein [Gemmatimonadales bacterium]
MTGPLWKRGLAESAGTFLLVLIGPGAMMLDARSHGAVTPLGVALAFTLAVAIAIWAVGGISGAHINPAVTVGLVGAGRFPSRDLPAYIGSQLMGALLAAALLRLAVGPVGHLGATLPAAGLAGSFALEFVMSFLLMAVILGTTDRDLGRWSAGVIIGLTVGLCAFVGGPYTGASMNPARSFGPALVGGEWAGHWIYWAAPLLGMLAAVSAWRRLTPPRAAGSQRRTR